MIPTLHLRLLGDFRLMSGDTPITTINSPRLQSMLAYLVLHRSAPQDRSHLAFLLWPDTTEERAHSNLRKLLHQLRQALPDIDHFLHIDRQTLYWSPAQADTSWSLDVQDLEQALAQAAQAAQNQDKTAQRQALKQAVTLYRGDLLPNCYDEWIMPERDRIRQLFFQMSERLIALLEEERAYDAAIDAARHLLRHDPLHEATYRQIMRLYALRGDRAAALRIYHTCVTTLERELGAEPSSITRTVYEALLQSDTSPITPTGPLTSRGTAPPLLGRQVEWQQLREAWRKVTNGHPHVVILTGEAGIGKTRLAEELEAWVSRQGMVTATSRCYTALGHLAYAPVTTWLRTDTLQNSFSTLNPAWLTEIARLVPEVLATRPQLPHPTSLTEGWLRQQFFEALAHAVLSVRQPLLLLLDDLQWCDNETLEWINYLLHFDSTAHLLLIGTVRAEETLPGHPLVAFLGALQRDHLVTEIVLGPLTTSETTSLAEHIMGQQLAPAMSNTLYSETEGNPLFIVEMTRAGTLEQLETATSAAKSSPSLLTQSASTLPPAVQSVLATRLAQLSPPARGVANVAAIIGREFSFSVLTHASGEDEDTAVRGLDELWQRRIVREQGASTAETYDFSHDKLREQAYASLSPAYRRLLHRRVAEAFLAVYGEELDTVSGQVAAHYEQAGQPAQAIPYYQRAGEVASRIYANTEAIHAFEQAISLLEAHSPGQALREVPWKNALQVYAYLGNVFLEIGRYAEARQAYHHAITYAPEQEYLWQARLQCKIARTWNYLSVNPHDDSHANGRLAFQIAERLLTQAADPTDPEWLQEWTNLLSAQIWPLRGSVDDMTATIEKARPIIEQYGTPEQRKLLMDAMRIRDAIRSRYAISAQTLSSRREALAEAQQTGNKSQIGTAHLALGILLLWANHATGQLDEAEEHLEQALKIAKQTGIVWLQMRCVTFLPFIFRRRGQVEQLRSILSQAETIGATQNNSILIGHQAWLAWRDHNFAEAETYGRAAVEEGQQQRMENNPFQWTGRWPLIGMALAQEKSALAIQEVRMLLDPTQQPFPEQLKSLLEAVLQAWDTEQQEQAHTLLQQAVPLAEKMGYL